MANGWGDITGGLPASAPPKPKTGPFGIPMPPPPRGANDYGTMADATAAALAKTNASKKKGGVKDATAADKAKLTQYLMAGDFAGAWKFATSFGKAYENDTAGKNPNLGLPFVAQGQGDNSSPFATGGSMTANPLVAMLETQKGLHELAPNMKWDAKSEGDFFKAATPYWDDKILGHDPNAPLWGDVKDLEKDATANFTAGAIPDLGRYAGKQPTENFGEKVADKAIAYAPLIALGVMSGGAGAAIGGFGGAVAGGAIGGAATTAYSDFKNDKPITFGSVGKGAGVGAVTAGLANKAGGLTTGLTNMGVNPTVANAVVKGGIGATVGGIGSAASGQGFGAGAKTGGVSALASGLAGGVVGGATGSNFLGSVAGKVAGGLAAGAVGSSGGGSSGGGVQHTPNGGGAVLPPGKATAGQGMPGNVGGGTNFIGNNTDMGKTDTTLASTIGDVLPGVLNTAGGVYGSQNAAEKQAHADDQAIQTQHDTMGNINDVWKTQRGLGTGADTALGRALGTDGKPADYSGFEHMPGYQFAIDQGTKAIQRQASAMGSAYTPNTLTSVGQYVTGTAMQDYNTYINQLMGAAGLGSTANTGVADASFKTGENISQLQQNKGQAEASGVMGTSKNIGGFLGQNGGSLIDALSKYFKGNGNGGSPNGGSPNGGRSSGGGGLNWGPGTNGDTVNGGIDPSTGIPNDIEQGGGNYDPWNGGNQPWSDYGNLPADSNWNSVTDTYGTGGSTDFGGGADYGGNYSGDWNGDFNFMGGP